MDLALSLLPSIVASMATPLPYLQEALTIAKFEPGLYEVVESALPDRKDP
jgi:hypothetical protein